MLRSDLCDYSDVYIVVKGNIDLTVNRLIQINVDLRIMRHLFHALQRLKVN